MNRRIGGAGAAVLGACTKAERILGVDVPQKDTPGRPANAVMSHTRFKYTIVSDENPQLQLDPVIIVNEPPSTTE